MAGYIGKGKAQSLTDVPDVINHDVDFTGVVTTDGLISSGNVGIGTSSPSAPLEVYGTGTSGRILLSATDSPMITNGWDKFTSGAYQGAGRWGLFMEPNTLTIGVKETTGAISFKHFNADSTSTERMLIDSNGNVGIGTVADSTPSTKLHIREDDSSDYRARMIVQATDNRTILGSYWQSGVGQYGYIQADNDAEGWYGSPFVIQPDGGNAHIGPIPNQRYAQLTIRDETGVSDWNNRTLLLEHNDGSGYSQPAIAFHAEQNATAGMLKFWGASGEFEFRNHIDNNFKSVRASAFTVSSDYRLKENVVPLEGAIDRIKQLPVHRFNFIDNPDVTVDGYLAHELAEVVPEAVTGEKDGMYTPEDGGESTPIYQGVDQAKVTPLLVAALQEAIARIETLEAEVATLKGAV